MKQKASSRGETPGVPGDQETPHPRSHVATEVEVTEEQARLQGAGVGDGGHVQTTI